MTTAIDDWSVLQQLYVEAKHWLVCRPMPRVEADRYVASSPTRLIPGWQIFRLQGPMDGWQVVFEVAPRSGTTPNDMATMVCDPQNLAEREAIEDALNKIDPNEQRQFQVLYHQAMEVDTWHSCCQWIGAMLGYGQQQAA